MTDIVERLRAGFFCREEAADEIERLRAEAAYDKCTIDFLKGEKRSEVQSVEAIHDVIASALASGYPTYSSVRQAARDVLALVSPASAQQPAVQSAYTPAGLADLLANLEMSDDIIEVGLTQFDRDLIVKALRANAQAAGWQPIETAPKDGTAIEACNTRHPSDPPVIVRWTDTLLSDDLPDSHWCDAATPYGNALYYNGRYFDFWKPTTPLPSAEWACPNHPGCGCKLDCIDGWKTPPALTSTNLCTHGVKVGNTCVDCAGAAVSSQQSNTPGE